MKERTSPCSQRWIGLVVLAIGTGTIAVIWLCSSLGRQAAAQQPAQIQIIPGRGFVQMGRAGRFSSGDADDTPEGAFLPVDRDTTRQWEKANSLLEDGHYADAVTLLDEILERGEDYFFKPQSDKPNYQSLKTEAQKLLGKMPAEGHQAYELQFGARAQQMLKAAAASGDISGLEDVARRYFHTQAGYQATLLLARINLDHDRPLAAALCLERLAAAPEAATAFEPMLSVMLAASWQRGGLPDRAEKTLLELKKKKPDAALHIADKAVPLFSEDRQALAWLDATIGKSANETTGALQQWLLPRGDAARNAASDGGMPLLNPLWRVSTTNHPTLEKTLSAIRQQYLDQGIVALPSMQPLAVNGLILMRTARDLLAVDFTSGKRIWPVRSSSDTSLEQMLSASTGNGGGIDPLRNPALIERFFEDATFGTLSCDGQQLYFIDGLDGSVSNTDASGPIVIGGVLRARGMFRAGMNPNGQVAIKPFNKLSAHELRSQGKLKWEVGGATGEDEPQLAGAFFLGPPLPLEGKLYVLAEMKTSEIKLCVLDAKTGKLDWSQQIAVVEQNIQQDPLRRLSGCSPSYADGVLICPTTAGAVVAVDLANRTLRWGYQYARDGGGIPSSMMIVRAPGGWQQLNGGIQMNPTERWADSSITIVGNYALVTPLESNELHVLNLLDGKLMWKLPRGDNLYVGGVHNGTAVLVGKHQVSLLKLAEDKPATTKIVDLPSGAMPSGRGFLSDDNYFLPLTSAEVAQVDLKSAKIVAKAKSRSGNIPGNLLCYQGEVVSQGVDYLETFFQRDPLEQRIAKTLKATPDDDWALTHRGEMELDAGQLDAAIADLKRAYEASADPANRDLLFQTLLEGLSDNYGKHKDALPLLEKLVSDDRQRALYLRVCAEALLKSGDIAGALDADLKLAALDLPADDLEELDAKLSVYRPRWVRAQFGELLSRAKSEPRKQIDAVMQRQLDQAIASKSIKSLRQFVDCFGDHPTADRARELLLDQLTGPETLLEREQILLALENAPDAAAQTKAMAGLAALMQSAGESDAALAQYRLLEAKAGDKPVANSKNVKQILAALPDGSPLKQLVERDRVWPHGEVKIEKPDASAQPAHATNITRVFNTEIEGRRSPFFTGILVGHDHDQQRREIVGLDGWGKDKFQIPLGGDANRQIIFRAGGNPFGGNMQFGDFAFAQGHILIVCTGDQLIALDTVKPAGGNGSRILWTKDLGDSALFNGNLPSPIRQTTLWGGMRRVQNQQTIFGDVALCGEHTLCFQHGHDVTAIDPLTGQTQWVRHGVENGCDLMGDEDYLVLAPPNAKPAQVLRTSDGALLGERRVPPLDKRWTNDGHNILAFREKPDGNQVTLALFDPYMQRDIWSENFTGWSNGQSTGLKGTLIDGENIALVQADGRLVILNLADGKKLIDERLEAEQDQHSMLQSLRVIRTPDQYFAIVDRLPTPGGPPRGIGDARGVTSTPQIVQSPGGEPICQLVTGHVYAFDRATGKAQWSKPAYVEQQGLLLGQPSNLPVITFIRNVQTFGGARNQQMHGAALCLDKRTGRAVYNDDDLPSINGFEISGNPVDKTVTLNFGNSPIQPVASASTTILKFTDATVLSAEPYQGGAATEKNNSTGDADARE